MTKRNLEGALLRQFYHEWYEEKEPLPFLESGVDPNEVEEALERLEAAGQIKARGLSATYVILPYGIARAESEGLVNAAYARMNLDQRAYILEMLAREREKNGQYSGIGYPVFAADLSIAEARILDHFEFLRAAGHIDDIDTVEVRITLKGLNIARRRRARRAFTTKLEEISKLEPTPRGRALQDLIAEVIDHEGIWKAKSGVWTVANEDTPREDTDVLIYQGMDYFNLESKWEKDPIDGDPIGKLFEKLEERVDQRGIVASMSGFNPNAIKKVRRHMNQKMILLFGKKSILALIHGERTFDEIVKEKHLAMVSKMQILED